MAYRFNFWNDSQIRSFNKLVEKPKTAGKVVTNVITIVWYKTRFPQK